MERPVGSPESLPLSSWLWSLLYMQPEISALLGMRPNVAFIYSSQVYSSLVLTLSECSLALTEFPKNLIGQSRQVSGPLPITWLEEMALPLCGCSGALFFFFFREKTVHTWTTPLDPLL